jgi:hypothetical protein
MEVAVIPGRQQSLFDACGSPGALFGGGVVAEGDMQQVDQLAHDVVFMRADLSIGIDHLPQVFDDLDLFVQFQLVVDERGKPEKPAGAYSFNPDGITGWFAVIGF